MRESSNADRGPDDDGDDVIDEVIDELIAETGIGAVLTAGLPAAPQDFKVEATQAGERLDKVLATWLPQLSRSRLRQWIEAGAVLIDGHAVKPRHALIAGQRVRVTPQPAPEASAFLPEAIPLTVVYEDASLIVVDKPPGLVVHPASGHWSGTLLNGLLAHAPELARLPRAGIVHRLDADTSGLMVVARTLEAQTDLVRQLQQRSVMREYWALVLGEAPVQGTIDLAIGRDRRDPRRFRAGESASAKPARTHYERLASVKAGQRVVSWLACRLETGRTHQIRVHLEHVGHPLLGDPVYRRGLPGPDQASAWHGFARQALHARRLGLIHPESRAPMQWQRLPPADMLELMQALGLKLPEAVDGDGSEAVGVGAWT